MSLGDDFFFFFFLICFFFFFKSENLFFSKNEKTLQKNKANLTELWDNVKHTNICVTGVSRGREREGTEKILEEMGAENFPNMGKEPLNPANAASSI